MIAPVDEDVTHGVVDEEMEWRKTERPEMMEQEQQLEHEWMSPVTTHHHQDHGKFDRVRCDKECPTPLSEALSISELVRGVRRIERKD